jgi:hypothetical protein
VSLTDVDFRDITIAGAAAPASGTRLGDGKGNSGITFDAAKTVYWNRAAGGNWSALAWATSPGGSAALNNFPLAQDTAVIQNTGLNTNATVTIDSGWNIGTFDMSARTNAMTVAGPNLYYIYGNYITGSGVTNTANGNVIFSGRVSQSVTSAGRTWTQGFVIANPGGSVVLQDAITLSANNSSVIQIQQGTLNANGYNLTLSGLNSGVLASGTGVRTIAIGSGTWTIAGSGGWNATTSTNLTITGTGTISLTRAAARSFSGGGISYDQVTINQGSSGTLTFQGDNRFKNITSTSGSATIIDFQNTTQTVAQFTAAGGFGRFLTLVGLSSSSPATLILTSGTAFVDYVNVNNVRAYPVASTWTAGGTNGGSLGFTFTTPIPPPPSTGRFFMLFP